MGKFRQIQGVSFLSSLVTISCLCPEQISDYEISNHLFRHGSQWDRPVLKYSTPVQVHVDIYLRSLLDVDQQFRQQWIDEIHRWNDSAKYNCHKDIVVPFDIGVNMWIPMIAVSDSPDYFAGSRPNGAMIHIYSDGHASLSTLGQFILFCKLDMTFFPFDRHNCKMSVEGYRFPSTQQNLTSGKFIFDRYFPDEQWNVYLGNVENVQVFYEHPSNLTFSYLYFHFTIERKPTYYILVLLIPFFVVSSLELITFVLPLDSSLRLSMSATCLLAFTFYYYIITKQLPHSSDRPSILLITVTGVSMSVAVIEFMQSIILALSEKLSKQNLKQLNRIAILFLSIILVLIIFTFSLSKSFESLRFSLID